jgi:exodeoxyribonuclease VII small subunit
LEANASTGKKAEAPRKNEFERSLARLEDVVQKLESPNLPLDDAMKLFEEGVQLARECQKQLTEAEGRVEILMKKAGGSMAAEPFAASDDEESGD